MRRASVLLSLLPPVAKQARHVEAHGEARERLPIERGLDTQHMVGLHAEPGTPVGSRVSVKPVAAVLK